MQSVLWGSVMKRCGKLQERSGSVPDLSSMTWGVTPTVPPNSPAILPSSHDTLFCHAWPGVTQGHLLPAVSDLSLMNVSSYGSTGQSSWSLDTQLSQHAGCPDRMSMWSDSCPDISPPVLSLHSSDPNLYRSTALLNVPDTKSKDRLKNFLKTTKMKLRLGSVLSSIRRSATDTDLVESLLDDDIQIRWVLFYSTCLLLKFLVL